MGIALRGNLQDFGIAEVFQLIGQQRKTGLLKVSNGGRGICMAFDAGSVVWAAPAAKHEHEAVAQRLIRCGYLTSQAVSQLDAEARSSGRSFRRLLVSEGIVSERDLEAVESLMRNDTIFDVLSWTAGSFDFLSQTVEHDRPQEKLLGAEQILMDGLRMVDEWQTFRESIPPLDTILARGGNLDKYRQQHRHDREQQIEHFERIYQLFDGRLTLQRVIDLSRIGLFDASRIVAEMVSAGLVMPVEARLAKVATREPSDRRSAGQWLRGVLVTCFPLLLLVCMVGWIYLQGAAKQERIEAFPIVREVFSQANTLFEKRKIRHALEAHRYLKGNWPEVLAGLDESGLLGSPAMAADSVAAYYYKRSESGIVLLAPER
ncbi:MAG: DUF4388 domain-containing protein [Myxococcales bacterium]|nr:DUF4388 domain-containing protein [Myxococcales bacterium]